MKIRRVGAYGISRDEAGRVLLARNSSLSNFPGLWTLPGGGVEQGEHPDDTVMREFGEETGLSVRIDGLHSVTADVFRLPGGELEHTDRVIYDVRVTGGTLRFETGGTTEHVEWIAQTDLSELPLMPFTAAVLGVGEAVESDKPDGDEELLRPARVQRFGAYAAATDPAGRILLTKIAPGYPGAGRWHLPGGGTDHGETPESALARELIEETSQHGRVTGLLGMSHRHDPAALGPEGVPIDWHVIRVLFRVSIDLPTEPVVTEEAGGSTAEAGWFTLAQARSLSLTELAATAVERVGAERAR
ncbi:NUDIX domain-containing protein [Actinoplanes sp. TRM 88003]|uniref:NUDIX domain-containing protein n=1 Tax=Paractinoplanes aksuensis TaxID=2939490 RepID=A0ABT1E1S3_9ACTN|nr:NUDIX domain-containing protein [Actinoplanes aksuensis]MCO8275786.1 NUDIX domain-containing protein [Actinoplanes aksuensis]